MIYKAENLDTDKAIEAIEYARKDFQRQAYIEREKNEAFLRGVERGLDFALSIFECSNYEKDKCKGDVVSEGGEPNAKEDYRK